MNFISNMLLICAYALIFGIKKNYGRISAAAAAGGTYAVCEAVFMLPEVFRAAALVLMAFIAFGRYKVIQHTLRLMILAIIAEGITIMAVSVIGADAKLASGRITVFAKGAPLFILYVLSYPCMLLFKHAAVRGNRIKQVYIRYNNRETHFNVLYDSGNLLKYHGRPVLIAEWEAVKSLMESAEYEEYRERASDFVLYRTIAKNGAVPVFEPEICRIDGEPVNISAAVVEQGFSGQYKGIVGSIG